MIKIPSTMFTPLSLLFAGFLSPCLATKKILCLHGGGGTGEGFANAPGMRDLEQALPDFEFVYANGGYPVAGFEETKEAFGTQSGHLWIPDPPGGKGEPTTDRFISDASIEALDEIRDNEGPFAGILGYSQGAAYVAVYLSRVPQDTFEFAVSFCGYPTLTHLGITDVVEEMTPFDNMSSLIWIGEQDSVIPNYLTRETIPFYQSPVVIESDQGGHSVPGRDDATFDEVVSFIESHRGDGNSEPDISFPENDTSDENTPDFSTKPPIAFPTIKPTDAKICEDSKSFRFRNKEKKTCKWVGWGNADRVLKKCKKKWQNLRVYDWCPQTCGAKVGLGPCA